MKKTARKQNSHLPDDLNKTSPESAGMEYSQAREEKERNDLRRKAEVRLSKQLGKLDQLSKKDIKELVHELGTYQIELEMQNEELRTAQIELERSRLRYADLYDFAPVGYFTFDAKGVINSLNLTGASMLGKSRSELINKPFAVFVHPEDKDALYLHITTLIREKKHASARFRLSGTKGSVQYVNLESVAVADDPESPPEIRSTVTDISPQIEAERKQRQKAGLLKAIIDTTEVMLAYLDPDFNFIWVNPAYARTCNMQPQELAGRNHFDLFPHPENQAIFTQVRDSGKPVFFKDRPFQFPDHPERGTTYWDWSLVPVKDGEDNVTGLVFSLRETTQYKQSELALARSEEEFRLIAETSTDIIFQTDTRGRITYISPAVEQLGYEPGQVTGRPFAEFIPAEELATTEDALQALNRGEKINLLELRIIRADGSMEYCEVSANQLKRKGFATGIQGIARLIGDRKMTEQKIRLHAELLQGINSIFQLGIHSDNDEELARKTLRIAEEVTGSNFGFIGEVGPDGLLRDLAISAAGYENCSMAEQTGHLQLPGNFQAHGLYGKVIADGRAFFTNDPAWHPHSKGTPKGHPALTAFLGIPLSYGKKTIGLIALGKEEGGYSGNELESLEILAPAFIEVLFKCRTERSLARSRAREHENALRLKQFLDFTPVPVWIAHDPDCRVITSNLAAAKLLDVDPDMNITQSARSKGRFPVIRHFREGRELTADELPLQYAIANGVRVDDTEIDIIPPSGEMRRMMGAATPLFDTKGHVQGGIAAFIDITERKWLEDQLLHAKKEWEKTFDAVPDLIAILDPQHRIIRVNRAMAARMGMTPGECVGKRCYTCVHGSSQPHEKCPNVMTLQDGREHRAEVSETAARGGDFLVTTTPLFDDRGDIVATVHVARDITDRKEAEQQIMNLNRNLQRTIRDLAIMNQELTRSNDDLEQYAYIISHDLQEPLRTISSFLQLLRRRYGGVLDEKADTYIDFTLDSAAHMQRLLRDLLLFSRVGGGSLDMRKVSLESIVRKILMNFKGAIEQTETEIQISALPIMEADETQLTHLFQNLIANAIKFHGENPPLILISAERKNDEWIICIRDNGIGIDPQYYERIFLIFQRLHRRGEYSGTGIGLAICRKIVERHGGRIWVESVPGEGAAFYVALPAAKKDHEKLFQ